MASTSSTPVQKSFKYGVFLSFRGEDVRKNFVDHLFDALQRRGIMTYKDNERIERGERIDYQLLSAIEDSRYHIIVFSKNYASSSWCLDELVKIMECQKMGEQTAYPIFYDVEPTEIRNQSGAVGLAFAKHEKRNQGSALSLNGLFTIVASCCSGPSSSLSGFTRLQDLEEDTGRWRHAMKEAAGLAGLELKNTFDGHEAKFIDKVVQDISLKLHFTNSSFNEKLVGMKSRIENVVSSLEVGRDDDVRMVGIKGMGGAGKTTLARAVFDQISICFECKSFVENVREGSKSSGLKELQKQILLDVSNDKNIVEKLVSVTEGKRIMGMVMPSRKVLLVLDDVDGVEQLEALAGKLVWFKPGSRIIITTRDERVLVAHGVNFRMKLTHDASLLTKDEAICLFSMYAFGREFPSQGYEQLSKEVLHYAKGLPLAIKILGSDLCGRSKREWVDAIARLEEIPEEQTLERLELSYIGLKNDQKEIFLDVACILKGERKEEAVKVLKSCGYFAEIGLKALEEKCLINISQGNRLLVHDLIEEMGRNIVRREHPEEPNKHSRLWIRKEIENILVNKSVIASPARSIHLKDTNLEVDVMMEGLRKMTELRLFYIDDGNRYGYGYGYGREYRRGIDEVGRYLPDTLRCLRWPGYPYRCLPKNFQANELVHLQIPQSNISELWEGGDTKVLSSLRFLTLSHSELRTFDLGMTPNLEILNLEWCRNLVEIRMPDVYPNLKSLNLGGTGLRKLNLELTPNLEMLNLEFCESPVELNKFVKLPHLEFLHLRFSKLRNLNLVVTPNLKIIDLERCEDLVKLNMPDECLHLEKLSLKYCTACVEVHIPVICPKLKSLNLICCGFSNLKLGVIPNLEKLDLKGCRNLLELNMSIELPQLKLLKISGSRLRNLNLEMAPHLEELDLEMCYDFAELYMPIECSKLKILCLHYTKVCNLNLGLTPILETLILQGVNDLVELHVPIECAKLKVFKLSVSKESKYHNYWLAPLLEKCKNLEKLSLCCGDIKSLPGGIWMLKHLKKLKVAGCRLLEELPDDLDRLECLEELDLSDCMLLRDIPSSICKMKRLKSLNLSQCIRVAKLPEDFGFLESLESLDIERSGIVQLPRSIFQLKNLLVFGEWDDLESLGLKSLTIISENYSDPRSYCYIKDQ